MKNNSHPAHFVVQPGIHGLGVFTLISFLRGQVLFELTGDVLNTPTRTSVQIGVNQHIEDKLAAFMNHSCTPNAILDRATSRFIACKDIQAGEEIMFDYNKNEDLLSSPFICECCGKKIEGASKTLVT